MPMHYFLWENIKPLKIQNLNLKNKLFDQMSKLLHLLEEVRLVIEKLVNSELSLYHSIKMLLK